MEKTYKILLPIFLLIFLKQSYSQTNLGVLQIHFHSYGEYSEEHLTIQIYQNNKLISENKEFLRDFESYIDTLPAGFYKISCYINFNKDLIEEVRKVEVIENKKTSIIFSPPTINTYDIYYDSIYSDNFFATLNISTGNNFVNPDDLTFSGYNQFGIHIGGTARLFKFAEIGQQFGSNMNYTYFNESKSLYPDVVKETEKYYYWNLSYMIFLRATLYNNHKKRKGLFIDGGISYNFPLLFRHVLVKENTKTVTKKIHHYNDFSAVCKLGYQPVALTFEYRLTNFLDKKFPEQPKMKLGISFIFGN